MSVVAVRTGVQVRHLRVRGGHEPLTTRLAADRVLGTADLAPSTLGPATVLVVRQLCDPWPRHLNLRSSAADREWQARARQALTDQASHAARPWTGPVPSDAEAVLFADRVELIACVLIDLARGRATGHWWWRALGLPDAGSVATVLMGSPELLPAVATQLADHGSVTTLATTLPSGIIDLLTAAMLRAYGLTLPPSTSDAGRAGARRPDARDSGRPEPPWSSWVSAPAVASMSRLSTEQQLLVGLALMLGDDPQLLRREDVVARIGAWRRTRMGPAGANPASRSADHVRGGATGAGVLPSAFSSQGHQQPARVGGSDVPQRRVHKQDRARARLRTGSGADGAGGDGVGRDGVGRDGAGRDGAGADGGRRDGAGADGGRQDGAGADDVGPSPEARPRLATAGHGERPGGAPWPVRAADPGTGAAEIATELAGLFHLVHLAQCLDLYADFTNPGRTGLTLGVWDFVTLVGRQLVDRSVGADDPVWRLLADLQGRTADTPPGIGFRPPRTWRVPASWLASFASDLPWRQGVREGRLVLTHPAGFVVVEGRADLDRELRRYGVIRTVPDSTTRERASASATARDHWAQLLAGFLRCRVGAAMGMPSTRAVRLMLRRPGRVQVTASRLDVTSELADLPIEVRVAAIDRDPGFVPDAGRSLYFHFH